MKLFDNNPQSKAMASLLHDSSSDLLLINSTLKYLEKESIINIELENIKRYTNRLQKTIDNYYTKFKNDFKTEI